MTPILGTMVGIVLTDYCNFLVSLIMVFLGAAIAVAMGLLFSLFLDDEVIDPENNSQITSRISPRLLDLVGALATGAVGSIALVRSDIAGSLPGVSIAISLVPPLCVAGVCIKLKNWNDMTGALLLFLTNFSCIIGVGACVMFSYQVHRMARRRRLHIARFAAFLYQNISLLLVLALLVGVGGMLWIFTNWRSEAYKIQSCLLQEDLFEFIYPKALPNESGTSSNITVDTTWKVSDVKVVRVAGSLNNTWHAMVVLKGAPPIPNIANIDEVGEECDLAELELEFIPSYRIEF